MIKCRKIVVAFMFILTLASRLCAQEVSLETREALESAIVKTLADTDEAIESAARSNNSASEKKVAEEDADESELEELDDGSDQDADQIDDDGFEQKNEAVDYNNEPVSVQVNENGELAGLAHASVGGNWLPVEANIALVSNGVLLGKIVADEDGSFAFPDVAPGSYTVYGTASSFCGQRSVTVLEQRGCCDSVDIGLSQDSGSACYSDLAAAPAATFSNGLGFSSGPISTGGGFAGGGGLAGGTGGFSGLRLLAVGGIVTAIAVGDGDGDDLVSPSN